MAKRARPGRPASGSWSHIGDTEKRYPAEVIRDLLPLMEPGDIVTHFFTANPGGVLDQRRQPGARGARGPHERGVWLDTAHGRANFSFDIGERVLDQGVETPLHQHRT